MAHVQDDDDEPITAINVVPLVDIVLVVLIIFMVTASYIVTPAIKVELPKATTAEPAVTSLLSLVLTREGDLYLNDKPVTGEDVQQFIRAQRSGGKELEAIIAADASVLHGRVVGLIDLIKAEGIVKFAINTQDDFSSRPAPTPSGDEAPASP